MSRRTPVSRSAWLQVAASILAIAAIAVVIGGVRRAAPSQPLGLAVDPALAPDDPAADLVTCERTLPQATTNLDLAEVPALGRISSLEVYECPDAFDGRVVVFIGEVVGDVLRRTGGAWVLVNDDDYALKVGPLQGHREYRGGNSGLAVWLPEPLVELAEQPGGPDRRGDILRIRGVLHRADPADGGGLTLRAITASRIAEAVPLEEPLNGVQALVAVLFTLGAIVLGIAERRAAGRR